MEKFEIQRNEALDLSVVRVLKAVALTDIIEMLAEHFDPHVTKNIIWEFLPGTLQLLNVDDLKSLMENRRKTLRSRLGGHTVFVTHDPGEHLLMKWYSTIGEPLAERQITLHLADDLDGAIELIIGNTGQISPERFASPQD